MIAYRRTTLAPSMFVLGIPIAAAAWLGTVPAFIVTPSFVACVVILAAAGWAMQNIATSAQPAVSLAGALPVSGVARRAPTLTSPSTRGPRARRRGVNVFSEVLLGAVVIVCVPLVILAIGIPIALFVQLLMWTARLF
jgi:hypothetical protein